MLSEWELIWICNVFFSNLKKFDGKTDVKVIEIGQIAGRAGRYLNDGAFGITGECGEISSEEVDFLENHKFDDSYNILEKFKLKL